MSLDLILLAPLLVLIIFVVFGFTGCASLADVDPWPGGTAEPEPEPGIKYGEIVEDTDGFVAHWPMNETAGETQALVNGPPNLNGVYMPGAVPGSPGAFAVKEPNANFAPELDGTTGYIEVPFSPLLNVNKGQPFSVEVWVKPAEALPDGAEQILISSHHISPDGNHRGYEIALIGTSAPHATIRGRVFWTMAPNVTNVDITPANGDPVAWRHIVLTHNGEGPAGNELRLYVSVEGVAGTEADVAFDAQYREVESGAGERPLRFGAGHLQAGGPEKFFAGLIDEVAFYNLALGSTDVELHFQAQLA